MAKDIAFLIALMLLILASIVFGMIISSNNVTVSDVTPLHKIQQPYLCTSPFDKYVTYEYELVDDNSTLITQYGRVYMIHDCIEYKDK